MIPNIYHVLFNAVREPAVEEGRICCAFQRPANHHQSQRCDADAVYPADSLRKKDIFLFFLFHYLRVGCQAAGVLAWKVLVSFPVRDSDHMYNDHDDRHHT